MRRVLTIAMVLAALIPSAADARVLDRSSFPLEFSGTINCGAFHDNFTDFLFGRETDFGDRSGNLTRIVVHFEHHSNDVNDVSGLTLHEHGHFTETIDLVAMTDTVTGSVEVANLPGKGVVVQDVGRARFDVDGNLIFFAGGRKHSELFGGDQVLCDALS